MTRSELVRGLSEATGLSTAEAERFLDALFTCIRDTLTSGEQVTIRGFGTLTLVDRPAREVRHPQTGQSLVIAATKDVRFRLGSDLAVCLGTLEGDGSIPPFRRGGGGSNGGLV